jgi:hypothetical protein
VISAARPLSAALAFNLSPMAFSTCAQLPSMAEMSSPLAAIGQFGFDQEGPSALLTTSRPSSPSEEKKACHCASTEAGSAS